MDTVGYILAFAVGCLTGGVVTYKLATDKAEERADLELAEMERYFNDKLDKALKKQVKVDASVEKKAAASHNKPMPSEIKKKAEEAAVNYTAYSDGAEPEDPVVHSVEPVILQEEGEFGEIEDYNRIFLKYYADNVLAVDRTRRVLSRQETIDAVGLDAIEELDKLTADGQPKDLVWVRNDPQKTYYEIERSYEEYSDFGWEDDEEY